MLCQARSMASGHEHVGLVEFSVETVPPFLRDWTWANASPHCPPLLVGSVDGLLTECAVFSGTWAHAVSLLLRSSCRLPKCSFKSDELAEHVAQGAYHDLCSCFGRFLFLTFENVLYIWGGLLFGLILIQFHGSELCLLNYSFPVFTSQRSVSAFSMPTRRSVGPYM